MLKLNSFSIFQRAANHPSISTSDLESFVRNITLLHDNGAVIGGATQTDNGWTYDNAVYFAITVVSTIGE